MSTFTVEFLVQQLWVREARKNLQSKVCDKRKAIIQTLDALV